ncbi:MAG: hypothetical protein OES57_12940 [Acidimicrobiia bacterium]|nr:hypothetical protein [Acidimicrobiia bacterium]
MTMMLRRTALALGLAVVVAACGGDGGREQAIAELVAAGWSDGEATCYVDATIDLAGAEALDPGAELSSEHLDTLYEVASRCRLTADEPLELGQSIGFGELTERDLNDALSEMTDDELIEWASLYGFDAGPLAADIAELRDRALDDLTITRGFELVEAQCIIDFLYRRLGKVGLDLGAAPTAEVAATEGEAIAACAPGR